MVSRGHLQIIKGVLIDLSGTLHVEDTAIPGACEALNKLKSSGLLVRFLTNTTKESRNVLLSRLRRCGFDISSEEIFSSLTAARQYIEKKNLNPLLLLENEALEDFEDINSITSSKENDAVVVGLAPNKFNYEDLNEAFRVLINGAELIAIHKGRYYSRGDGLAMGPGPFVSALEYATGKTACVLGKPEKSFFHSALEGLNCEPHEVVMIGDDIRDDVEGALCAGLQAILVRTGKYRPGDEDKSKILPSAVCNNFSAAVDFILENSNDV